LLRAKDAGMGTLDVKELGSLQAALDRLPATGGAIYIPTGEYALNEPAYLELQEGQHLFIYGDGRGSSLHNRNRDGQPLLHLKCGSGMGWFKVKVTVRDLSFLGTPDSGDGLFLEHPNDAMVDACFFQGHGGYGLRLGPSGTNVTVRDCWLRDCKRGIRADNIHHLTLHGTQTRSLSGGQEQAEHLFLGWECREVRVVNNHFAYGHAQAIILDGTAQHVIANNTIEGFPIGIEARGRGETLPRDRCRDMVIANNYLHADTAVLLQGECRGFAIQGNNIINNPQGAIVVRQGQSSGGHSITGNVIRKSVYDGEYVKTASPEQRGIDLEAAESCLVSGNVFEDLNPGPAITAQKLENHLIEGNLIRKRGQAGLQSGL